MPAPRPTFDRFPERQPDLFLSHSSSDKPFVRKLIKDLSSVGIDVWFDEWEIEIGDSLHESIGRGLQRSRFVAVVISSHSSASDWCKNELDVVLSFEKKHKQKRVLPLLYEKADVPAFLEGRVYQDLRGAEYFPGVTFLAGLVHGFSKQALSEAVVEASPRDLGAVAKILRRFGWTGRFYLDPMLYDRHREQIFEYCGKDLEDLSLDEEYYGIIAEMQKSGITIFPLRWPLQ